MTQARDLGDAANKANFLDNISSDIAALIASATPAGIIVPFGGTSAPTGYLACDGSAVSRTTYADLFAALSTTWGTGDGSSTFNVPDLRGAFLRGTGSHGTQNMANGNDFAGPSVGSFENDQFQGHKHTVQYTNNASGGTASGIVRANAAGSFDGFLVGNTPSESNDGAPRTGDETRPFNAGILYCIKT